MLLQHAWLAPLDPDKIDTISEEDEEAAEAAHANGTVSETTVSRPQIDGEGQQFVDKEVGEWVRQQIQRKKDGLIGKHRKPALHAAPLDAVPSPVAGKRNAGAVAV